MSDEEQNSLSDDQIKADYRTDPNFLPALMKEVTALDERLKVDGGDLTVPRESLRTIQMGVLALVKNQTEMVAKAGLFTDSDHGDRGANCDYNPFIRVNTGDIL